MRASLIAVFLVVACGGKDITQGDPDSATGDGAGSADATIEPGWTKLVSRTWSLPGAGSSGSEGYQCRRVQIPTDMWISAFRAMSPTGTHHEVVTIDPNGTKTGDYPCSPSTGAFNSQMVYAAGVNTDDLAFPTGVAVHIAAGTWINLNLHLFNLQDNAATGESGILVKTVPAADVVHPADMTFAGTAFISIPSDGQPHIAVGGCAAPADWHLFTLWPHMHQTATHQKVVVTPQGGAPTTMLDASYQFGEQVNHAIAETVIHAGDQLQVTCTYLVPSATCSSSVPCAIGTCNTADHLCHVSFGDSSTSEMCFTGMYKYPAGGGEFGCVTGL